MPTSPTLPTSPSGPSGHLAASGTAHTILNGIYKLTIGTTRTSAYTVTQANQGEFFRVDSASAVVITVPVLEAGTIVQVGRKGAGAVTFTASGTTFVLPTGAAASARVTGSIVTFVWATTTEVWLSGDLT